MGSAALQFLVLANACDTRGACYVECGSAGHLMSKPRSVPKDHNLIYFRNPDVIQTEGFELTNDVSVTFKLYIDEKGTGAYDVSMA